MIFFKQYLFQTFNSKTLFALSYLTYWFFHAFVDKEYDDDDDDDDDDDANKYDNNKYNNDQILPILCV